MAQSATTVTPNNPTPPTNLSCVGSTPPLDPAQAQADDGIAMQTPNANSSAAANGATYNEPSGTGTTIAAKTAAAGSGTSVDGEGKGTETVVTATVPNPSPAGQLKTVSVLGNYTTVPNQQHASSLSPATNPTLTSISPTTAVSGATGTDTITATGVGFNRQSVIYVYHANGLPVRCVTTFVSSTSLTAPVPKRTAAGASSVDVITGGVVGSGTPKTLTYS